MTSNLKQWIQAILALVVVVPTVAVLVWQSVSGSEWAIGTLVAFAVAVLAFYGYKVKQIEKKLKAIRASGAIPSEDIIEAYKKAFKITTNMLNEKRTCFHISDESYKPIDMEKLKQFLKDDPCNLQEYNLHDYDCDDFSFALMGALHMNREMAACPFFITWADTPKGGHAVLTFYYDGEVKIIEPQTDEIFDIPEGWTLWMMEG